MKVLQTIFLLILLGFHCVSSSQNNDSEDPFIPIIDLLEVSERYEIVIKSIGCFHNRQQSLFIKKEENSFIALLNETEVLLTTSQVSALRSFERQLKYVGSAGCTTVDTYILKYGTETTIYNDDTCSRFFGKVLLKELGFAG